MANYSSLREYVKELDRLGKLVTIKSPINKDCELSPLVYLQWRGLPITKYRGFLFTNVIDSRGNKYEIPVAWDVFGGDFTYIGLKCKPEEVDERIAQAYLHPLDPEMVSKGPVQEVVYTGKTLLAKGGMDEFPVPVTHPGWDGSAIMSSSNWVTKDIETGIRNVGLYRSDVCSQTRTNIHIGAVDQDLNTHWQKCRALGIPLEAAIVIGGPPNLNYVAHQKMPYGLDEYSVAGAMVGEPVPLVKCKTIDLEVPANADIVLEGLMTTKERMIEGPHGEGPGLVSMGDLQPFFDITCITHRKDAMWVGPANDYGTHVPLTYKRLKYDLKMDFVLEVAITDDKTPACVGHGRSGFTVLRIKHGTDAKDVWRALEEAHGKITVAVDEEIDPRDVDMIMWCIRSKSEPHRDSKIVNYIDRHPLASDYMPEPLNQAMRCNQFHPDACMPGDPGVPGPSRLLIDTTQKWPFPPMNVPKKEFMDRALEIWNKEGLGPLDLVKTYYGFEQGFWPKEYAADAERATKGQYYKTYEKRYAQRVNNEDIPIGDYYANRGRWKKYPKVQKRKK